MTNPVDQTKENYAQIINRIKSDSAVGIDAQFTHAVIISYLEQISQRLDVLENAIKELSD